LNWKKAVAILKVDPTYSTRQLSDDLDISFDDAKVLIADYCYIYKVERDLTGRESYNLKNQFAKK